MKYSRKSHLLGKINNDGKQKDKKTENENHLKTEQSINYFNLKATKDQ